MNDMIFSWHKDKHMFILQVQIETLKNHIHGFVDFLDIWLPICSQKQYMFQLAKCRRTKYIL